MDVASRGVTLKGVDARRATLKKPWMTRAALRATGSEPDYRFTLANERTFLAYVRTSLAFLAGGTAVIGYLHQVVDHQVIVNVIGIGLFGLGIYTVAGCYRRWHRVEMAIRKDEPLPYSSAPAIITTVLILISTIAFVAVLVGA